MGNFALLSAQKSYGLAGKLVILITHHDVSTIKGGAAK